MEPPIFVVAPGRTYRNETLDARHSPVFHQIEALAVDRGITLADLFGTIETFVRRAVRRRVASAPGSAPTSSRTPSRRPSSR